MTTEVVPSPTLYPFNLLQNKTHYLVVLLISNLGKEFSRRVLDVEKLEDGSSVISDRGLTSFIDEHLVESDWSKRGFDNVGDGRNGGNILGADALSSFSVTSKY